MSKNTHRIIIDINDDWVDITSEELKITYCSGAGCHGLQCVYPGGTERYDRILDELDEIANKSRRVDDLIDDIEVPIKEDTIKNKNNMNANDKLKKWLEGI